MAQDKAGPFTFHDGIIAINPQASFSMEANNYESIAWGDGTTPISKEDIEAKLVEMEADWIAKEYARDRRENYPDWNVQLEKIYDDGVAKWKSEMVDPIKVKFPKP